MRSARPTVNRTHPNDVYVIEEECTWPAGHAGEHRGDFDEADTADPASTQALRKFREAAAVAADKRAQWEDAEEALDALRCNQGPAGEWPCILRRGHDGEHEHPPELHLVGWPRPEIGGFRRAELFRHRRGGARSWCCWAT